MKNDSLISVIVPIYNTQSYLGECIQSIRSQTYENIEIILIDDGSTDNSLALCKKFARSDRRIIILEKQNSGVSDARNLGIEKSNGEYITFVDSDDIISSDLIGYLLDNLVKNNSDISVCKIGTYTNKIPRADKATNSDILILDNQQSVEALLYQKFIKNSVSGKLYNRDIVNELRFPKSIAYGEDLLFNYYALSGSDKVVVSNETKYYYRQRIGSAMNSEFKSKMMDSLDVAVMIQRDSIESHPSYLKATRAKVFTEAITLFLKIPNRNRRHDGERSRCVKSISRHKYAVIFNHKAKFAHRIYSFIAILSIRFLRSLLLVKMRLKKVYYV